jgi:capsular polysaccharide biosynthesis protein
MILTNHAAMTNDGNLLFGRAPSSVDSTSLDRLWRLEAVQKHSNIPSKVLSAEVASDYALAVNAVTHKLHFVAENLSNLIFKAYIYDLQGNYRGSFRADEEFDLNKLPGGTYLVSWQFAGQYHSAKFYHR